MDLGQVDVLDIVGAVIVLDLATGPRACQSGHFP